jgi:hypothetical protein
MQQDTVACAVPPFRKESSQVTVSDQAYFVSPENALSHHLKKPLDPMIFTDYVADLLKGGFSGSAQTRAEGKKALSIRIISPTSAPTSMASLTGGALVFAM